MVMTAVRRAVVCISGDDIYEDLFGVGSELARLASSLGFASNLRMGMGWLDRSADVDLIVLYSAMGALTGTQLARLRELVTHGAGLLVVHSTTVFPTEHGTPVPPFDGAFALYGSRYVSHGPRPHSSRFTVYLDQDHELTSGLDPFDIDHEHYQVELAPDARVVGWRITDDHREPIVHVRDEGQGRVAYLQLGHDTRALAEPGVRALIGRAVSWLTSTESANGKGND